jgi:diadenosine tetraphosphate (Ap4A) HIT family hydrolase
MHFRPVILNRRRDQMPSGDFELDPKLAAETHAAGELPLARVLLFDDARFPWLVLVPRRRGLVEITDLPAEDRHRLLDEIGTAMDVLQAISSPHKLNVAALGNSVRQLHVHVIARFETDAAWPLPVWGRGERVPYGPNARAELLRKLRQGFGFR